MGQPKNRVEKYFADLGMQTKPKQIEFEKFDPRIIQNVVQEALDDDFDSFEEKEQVSKKLIVSQDSQLMQTLNMWIGHCKKNITPNLANKINGIDGVETLDVITRYRFRVGIGKLFKDEEVKANIAKLFDK